MDRLLTRGELVRFCPEVTLPIANRVAIQQDDKTAAIVRAEERKALGKVLDSHHHFGGPRDYYVEVVHTEIEALLRGEAPAGWPEKEG